MFIIKEEGAGDSSPAPLNIETIIKLTANAVT
jgi:hypothetical protein